MNKFTGVFIKWLIFLAANGYIIYKIAFGPEPFSFQMLTKSLTFPQAGLFAAIVLTLMPLNWLLEAIKWKYLLHSISVRLTTRAAYAAVLNGLAVGIFTPNRVGEFAGKILALQPSSRPQGLMVAVFSSLTQLFITVLMAIAAVVIHRFFFIHLDAEMDKKLSGFPELLGFSVLFLILSFLLIYFLFFLSKANWIGKKLGEFLITSRQIGSKRILMACLFSFARYLVFLFQYWIVLYWFGITDPDWKAWILLPLVFFSISIIPGIMVFPVDVSVRGAASIFFLSVICVDEEAILFASLLIWLVNLAVPAFAGSILLIKNKWLTRNDTA